MSKQASEQKGVGVTTKLTSSPPVAKSSAKIPSGTIATSPNSSDRGKQG